MIYSDTRNWLVVLLRPSLAMAFSASDPGDGFAAEGQRYGEAYQGDIVATYDRLIDADGRAIGIQIWPVAAYSTGFLQALPTRSYLKVDGDQVYVQLYFTGHPAIDAENAGEQSVVGRIYRATSGEFAVATDLGALGMSDRDVAAIRAAHVSWVTLGP